MPRKAKNAGNVLDWQAQAQRCREHAAALGDGPERDNMLVRSQKLEYAIQMTEWLAPRKPSPFTE